ncbi:hypothetical protein K2X89_08605, partial [Myxococcota bacterium]|nr:hypothetical protein [Myxococcota bacterium]
MAQSNLRSAPRVAVQGPIASPGSSSVGAREEGVRGESAGVAEDRIDVVGRDGHWPFNQGRLLQSLYPTGLEPDQALEVVVGIE